MKEPMKLNTYLNYGGNCSEAFRFYEMHLGAKILTMSTFADMPEPRNIPTGLEPVINFRAGCVVDENRARTGAPADRSWYVGWR